MSNFLSAAGGDVLVNLIFPIVNIENSLRRVTQPMFTLPSRPVHAAVSPARHFEGLVTAVETALERELPVQLMHGRAKSRIRWCLARGRLSHASSARYDPLRNGKDPSRAG
jgi:hypothetical protein